VAAQTTAQNTAVAITYGTDASGDIINAATGAIVMTAAQAAANGVTAASLNAGLTTTSTAAPSWFTDPNQALISGMPNWELLALGGAGIFLLSLLKGKK
jgi:acid phosphatase family membrane protein YuiD